MRVIESEQIIMWDVDDTLVMWLGGPSTSTIAIKCPYSGRIEHVTPHKPHIKILKDRKARGATNIVWSSGGFKWAEAVVKALEIQQYVDLVLSKPCMHVEDGDSATVLGPKLYLSPDSKYGT